MGLDGEGRAGKLLRARKGAQTMSRTKLWDDEGGRWTFA
jgi:hypothetical protein